MLLVIVLLFLVYSIILMTLPPLVRLFCMQALSSVAVSAILRIARRKHAIADQQFNDFPFDDIFHDTVLSFWPDAPDAGNVLCVR